MSILTSRLVSLCEENRKLKEENTRLREAMAGNKTAKIVENIKEVKNGQ